MPLPNQLPKLNFEGIDPVFQQWLHQLVDTVNTHSGYNGPIQVANHLDMGGNRITGVAAPVADTDVVTHAVAQASYSASALKPQLESNSSNPLTTYRIMNSGTQREAQSSWLNDLMSPVPSATAIFPQPVNIGGGVQVTIPSEPFTFADRSTVILIGRTDILSFPSTFSIISISVSGNVVTVVTSTPTGLTVGAGFTVFGVTPSQFNGSFTVASIISSTSFTYQNDIGTGSGSGGEIDLNNVYYYAARKRSNTIHLLGPYSGDTARNRLNAGYDGNQIIAVVTLIGSGALLSSTGGGGSPITGSPAAGAFF